MHTQGVCSHCLRALWQTARTETGVLTASCRDVQESNFKIEVSRAQAQTVASRRYLSTAPTRWQQQAPRKVGQEALGQPVFPPTTAATITTNITAPAPAHTKLDSLNPAHPPAQYAPPTTASTPTTNVTAPLPSEVPQSTPSQAPEEHKSAAQLPSSTSVSRMQQQIQSSLASSRPKSLPLRLASSLKQAAPSVTKTYTIYGQTEALFKSCALQADYTIPQDQRMNVLTGKGPAREASQEGAELGQPLPENAQAWWFMALNLPPTFSTWSQVTFLHMYVIVTQLRAVLSSEAEFSEYHRYLIEHFSRAAEDKMILLHNLNAQGVRSRYLKDILLQWRGIMVSYDEGLVKGDAVLASAIWRNLFRANESVDWVKVASIVAFLRLAIRNIGDKSMDQLIAGLDNAQTSIWPAAQSMSSIAALVGKPSQGISAPIE